MVFLSTTGLGDSFLWCKSRGAPASVSSRSGGKVKVVDDILGRAGQGNRIVPDRGRTDVILNDPMTGKLTSNETN